MPVGRVGGGGGREWTGDLGEGGGAGRVPEGDGVGREVNLVGKVVPHVGDPVDVPLGLTANEPAEVVVWGGGGVAVDPAVLHLGEMRLAIVLLEADTGRFPGRLNLQEVDLMLVAGVWWVGVGLLHAEVVVKGSRAEICLCLRNQLSPPHVRVPKSGWVNGDLDTLLASTICWVLVAGREVDVGRDRLGTVNVVLVWSNLVGPRPLLQISARGEVVESSIPDDSAGTDKAGQGNGDETENGAHVEEDWRGRNVGG